MTNRHHSPVARGLGLLVACVALISQTHCAKPSVTSTQVALGGDTGALFSATTAIEDQWQHLRFRGATEYRIYPYQGELAIRAVGRGSASGLIRRVEMDIEQCPRLEWRWSVATLQPGADIRERRLEDVGASIMLFFGDPGFAFDPTPVPTLRYVWTNERVATEMVVDSPYMPGIVRSLVVVSGATGSGGWVNIERNVDRDFRKAFGHAPPGPVQALAIFTDNDQTGEKVEAYYAWARALCE